MSEHSTRYIADRKSVTFPVVVSRSLYLAIGEIMYLLDCGERTRAMEALGALYFDHEMGPLIRELEDDFGL